MAHTDRAAGRLPSVAYEEGVAAGEWQGDPAQRAVLPVLDRIHREVIEFEVDTLRERVALVLKGPPAAKGLYLYGGVGRGKTFLIDLLHDSVPERLRFRLHFHRFMGRVHTELRLLANTADPMKEVARRFAQKPLICLDEFFVQDIGDAMMLAEFLKHLRGAGGTLVTTSNIPPADLYKDGLQRAKFMSAISWIGRHCDIHHLESATDYRLRALTAAPTYRQPLGAAAEDALAEVYDRVVPGSDRPEAEMVVNDRPIALKRRADGVAWFEFGALCLGPRSVADYIEIAKSYNTVLLSNVPRFSRDTDDAARRFVNLIDEFYDRGVNVVLSAAAPVRELYGGERLKAEFGRTESRLIEMQSEQYLARPHKP